MQRFLPQSAHLIRTKQVLEVGVSIWTDGTVVALRVDKEMRLALSVGNECFLLVEDIDLRMYALCDQWSICFKALDLPLSRRGIARANAAVKEAAIRIARAFPEYVTYYDLKGAPSSLQVAQDATIRH